MQEDNDRDVVNVGPVSVLDGDADRTRDSVSVSVQVGDMDPAECVRVRVWEL